MQLHNQTQLPVNETWEMGMKHYHSIVFAGVLFQMIAVVPSLACMFPELPTLAWAHH